MKEFEEDNLRLTKMGNRPLEPRELEVEFFPMEEVLYETDTSTKCNFD
jgi:hypothetical protein